MLGLFGKKSDHPLANLKQAQELLHELPKHDALKSLQELTAWFESVREQKEFRLDQQVAVVRLLDETARPFERKLTREYYSANVLSTFHENRLWIALNDFFDQLLLTYLNVLIRYRNNDKGTSSVKVMLPLISARGINAAMGKIKLVAARYAQVDQILWGSLAEFYLHAEENQYLYEQMAIETESGITTTVHDEFAAVLMWYESCFGRLTRLHTHLGERLIVYLRRNFKVSAQREADSRFLFDLLHPMSPMRIGAGIQPKSSQRFVGVNNIQPRMDALLKTLNKNIVPDEINLGGKYSANEVGDVVQHLFECFAHPPKMRRNMRHNIRLNLQVINGFTGMLEQGLDKLEFADKANTTWQVEDISISGIRCVPPTFDANSIKVGLLLGIRPENVKHWGVGMIRRICRDPQNNLLVGIEMLSNQVVRVELRQHDTGAMHNALWLECSGGDSREVDLLMGVDTYSASSSQHVQLLDKSYLLLPLALLEKGDDYEYARYRKIEQDTTSD